MKVVVILSGGQDSTTCLYWTKREFPEAEIHAVTFDYGQRHKIELEAAAKIAGMAECASHEIIKLGDGILKSTSPLVSDNELEQYKDHQSLPGGLEKTFVPHRNMLFLTVAANRAAAIGAKLLVTGVCQEDYGGYPDCRMGFISDVEYALRSSVDDASIGILTPLMLLTKAQSVRLAADLPGCLQALAYSHTAYDGKYPPVGRDHASLLRAKGFEEAGIPDPLVVRAVAEGLMDYPETANYGYHKSGK